MVSVVQELTNLNAEKLRIHHLSGNYYEIPLCQDDHLKCINPLEKAIKDLSSFQASYEDYCNKAIEKIEMNKKSAERCFSMIIKKLKDLIEKIYSTNLVNLEENSSPLNCILASIGRTSLDFSKEFENLSYDISEHFPEIHITIWNNDIFEEIDNKITKLISPSNYPYEGYAYHKFSNGDYFIGEWKNNLFNGKGAYYNRKTDSYYQGEFENHYMINGKNWDSKGNIYLGSFEKNLKSGQGIQKYANDNIYEGSWANNLPNGQGLLKYSFGDSSSGNFDNGKLNGKGLEVYYNGDSYEGEFEDGFKSGYGIYKYSCGDYYEGSWQFDQKNGKGKLVYQEKGCYEGEFEDDTKHGFGKEISYPNQEVYIGYFENDKKNGHGTLVDGCTKFEGEWHMDSLNSEE